MMLDSKRLAEIEQIAGIEWGRDDPDNPHLATAGMDKDGCYEYPFAIILDLLRAVRALMEVAKAGVKVRRMVEEGRAYAKRLQELAAEARRTGQSLTHRIKPRAFTLDDPIADLLTALAAAEKEVGL